jgi:hypothetical protein
MIVSASASTVISSLGWVDHGNLWVLSTSTGKIDHFPLSDARALQLFVGSDDHFSVQHFWGNDWDKVDQMQLTAHSFDNPSVILARIVLRPDHETFEGDSKAWEKLAHVYLGPLKGHYYLFIVDPTTKKVERQRLDWFEKQYNTDYQGIGPALEVPRSHFVLLPIQRSPTPILYDLVAAKVVREIDLGAAQYKPGTPQLAFSSDGKFLYALNYDTLVQLDRSNWRVLRSLVLQNSGPGGSIKFVGSFSFAAKEGLCVVARPYSSDVAIVDMLKMQAITHVRVGGQPLQVVMLVDGTVFARDWHTGELLTGWFKN